MTWLKWLRRIRAEDKSAEARAELRKLADRDAEVRQLGEELRATQLRNNFSGMVQRALSRGAREGS